MPPLRTDSTTCQLGDRGVRVAVNELPDGVEVVVTTIRDVDELRQRARDAAAMYGPGAHRGLGHDGKHGDGARHGLHLAELRAKVNAVETDIPDGASIRVTPLDPAKVGEVQSEVEARVEKAQWGNCR
jgi:hypothetical protein